MSKQPKWKPIEKLPKYGKKGVMRVFTFETSYNERRPQDAPLERMYSLRQHQGSRVCDAYIEIPIFEEKTDE